MAAVSSILIGTAIAGMGVSAYGQVRAGQAARRAGESAAEAQDFNADVAELQAEDALERGREAESSFRRQVRGFIGRQRAGFAGQGVKVGSGSALDVQADTAYLGELDAQQIRVNSEREAWGYRVEAADRRMSADVARRGGAAAARAGYWGAAGTLLGGTSSLLQSRYGFDRNVQVTRPA